MNKTFSRQFSTLLTGIAIILIICTSGCQKYGSVSPKTYEVAKSLYSTCNRQDQKRLDVIETLVSESQAATEISASEAKWLLAIIEKAKSDQWEQAMLDARVMMSEQAD